MRLILISTLVACGISTVFGDASIIKFANSLTLSSSFDPILAAYWTGLPHHRRTPFAVSPDGKSGYIAYLDSAKKNVIVQQVDLTTFTGVGTAVTIPGFEAAGLVAHDDGFAVMATVTATGPADLPPNNYPIAKLFRYMNGAQAWATALNGPGINAAEGFTATPDANGDLVYNAKTGLYGAYFVVTAYTGWASGHFGGSIQYVNDAGALQIIPQSNQFGCSHNTGIGFEAADEVPYASICAEDHGAIWLNTDTRSMNGVKIANENATNGVSGEPMGGMGGSYSNLARFPSTTNYVFAWQSRGALKLTQDTWRGNGYTQASPRWLNHNVAIAPMSAKNKLTGAQATSTVGAAECDLQVNWITKSETDDHQNVHVAALNSKQSIVTWETLTNPDCKPVPLSCTGTYAGTSFQLIDNAGVKVGGVVTDKNVFVSGDIANVGTDKVCWPYLDIVWDLSRPKSSGGAVTKMSFACASIGGGSSAASSAAPPSSAAASSFINPVTASKAPAPAPTTSQAPVPIPTTSQVAVPAPVPNTSQAPALIPTTSVTQPITSSTSPVIVVPIPTPLTTIKAVTTSSISPVTTVRTTTLATSIRTTSRMTSKTSTTRRTTTKKTTTRRTAKTRRTRTTSAGPVTMTQTTTLYNCPA